VLNEIQAALFHCLSYDTGAVLRASLAKLMGHRLQDHGVLRPTAGA
jgi:hypothetical protein